VVAVPSGPQAQKQTSLIHSNTTLTDNHVCPKITNITGKEEASACKITYQFGRKYNKKPRDLITIYEFCEFTGLNEEKVQKFLVK
jgi:hypothetical protein